MNSCRNPVGHSVTDKTLPDTLDNFSHFPRTLPDTSGQFQTLPRHIQTISDTFKHFQTVPNIFWHFQIFIRVEGFSRHAGEKREILTDTSWHSVRVEGFSGFPGEKTEEGSAISTWTKLRSELELNDWWTHSRTRNPKLTANFSPLFFREQSVNVL